MHMTGEKIHALLDDLYLKRKGALEGRKMTVHTTPSAEKHPSA
jgi:hypothetical protein